MKVGRPSSIPAAEAPIRAAPVATMPPAAIVPPSPSLGIATSVATVSAFSRAFWVRRRTR